MSYTFPVTRNPNPKPKPDPNELVFGKQFTDRFGIAYEQGIDTVSSVLKITWSLSRNWEVILRGGTNNGVDLQYRRRFDRLWDKDKKYESK